MKIFVMIMYLQKLQKFSTMKIWSHTVLETYFKIAIILNLESRLLFYRKGS